jgi:hypothetical protein
VNEDQAKAFLMALGAKKPQKNGKWIGARCPLSPVTHQHNKDLNPSFGLTCEPDKPSRWNCFACGSGSAIDLIQQMEFYALSGDFALARQILESEDLEVVPLPEFGEFSTPEDSWKFTPWPESWLEQFLPIYPHVPPAVQYMLGRGVLEIQMLDYDLRWDAYREMVIFPLRDAYGVLAGGRGRAIDDSKSGGDKHHDYSHNGVPKNIKGVWYGEQALQLEGPVIVVEGQIDLLKVRRCWPKSVANFTAKPTQEKVLKLAFSQHVVLIPDNDKTGEQSIAKYAEMLAVHDVPMSVLKLPPTVKDPGDCHPEFLKNLIDEHMQHLW